MTAIACRKTRNCISLLDVLADPPFIMLRRPANRAATTPKHDNECENFQSERHGQPFSVRAWS